MAEERETWVKPELQVLARMAPEEMVLTNCKSVSTSSVSGASAGYVGCKKVAGWPFTCSGTACSTIIAT